MRRLALSNLVFVVREDEVHPSGVNIEGLPEVARRHRRALDVPARSPAPPRTFPTPFVRRRALPEREIERVALLFAELDARTGDELVDATPRELAVAREAPHREIHVALSTRHVHDVRAAFLDELLDEHDDLFHVLADARFVIGVEAAYLSHLFLVDDGHPTRESEWFLAVLLGPREDLVVDVGDVANVDDALPE